MTGHQGSTGHVEPSFYGHECKKQHRDAKNISAKTSNDEFGKNKKR